MFGCELAEAFKHLANVRVAVLLIHPQNRLVDARLSGDKTIDERRLPAQLHRD